MLQEADYGITEMAHGDANRYQGDEVLLVRFFSAPIQDSAATLEAGRPIFKEVPYIEIMQPGNKDSIIQRPARDTDKHRFPKHWRAYQDRQSEDYIEGTLLEQWPGLNRAQVEELRYFNVRTVEQLASMSDSNSQGMMGINILRDKAKAYLEASRIESAAAALAEKDARIDQLVKALEDQGRRLAALEDGSDED